MVKAPPTYRRVGAVTTSVKLASECLSFLVYFEDRYRNPDTINGIVFLPAVFEEEKLRNQVWEYLVSQV